MKGERDSAWPIQLFLTADIFYMVFLYGQVWKKEALVTAAGFFAIATQRLAFNSWAGYAAWRHSLSSKLGVALARWSTRRLAPAFARWREQAAWQQQARATLTAAVSRLRHRSMAAAWATWRAQVDEALCRNSRLAAAVCLWQRSRLAAAWAAWTDHHTYTQKARAVVTRFYHRRQAEAWAAWRHSHQRRLELYDILSTCVGRWRHAHQAASFTAWRKWVEERRDKQAKLAAAVQRWTQATLAGALCAWCSWGPEQRRRRELLQGALSKLLKRQLALAWSGFSANVERQQRKRRALVHFTQSALVRAWNAWRAHIEIRAAAADKLAAAVALWHTAMLRSALAGWAEAASEQRHKRHLLSHALGWFMQSRLCGAWEAWRSHAACSADQRARVAAVLGRIYNRQAGAAFVSWTQAVQWRRMKTAADAFYAHQALRRSMEAFKSPLQRQAVAQACLARLMHRQQAAAFVAWAEFTRERQVLRARAEEAGARAAARLTNGALAAALASWRDFAARNRRLRAILQHVIQREAAAAVTAWRQFAATRSQARKLMQRALLSTQAAAFVCWREATEDVVADRRALEQAAAGVARGTPKRLILALQGRDDLSALMAAWEPWRARAAETAHLHRRALLAYRHLYMVTARRCFNVLRRGTVTEGQRWTGPAACGSPSWKRPNCGTNTHPFQELCPTPGLSAPCAGRICPLASTQSLGHLVRALHPPRCLICCAGRSRKLVERQPTVGDLHSLDHIRRAPPCKSRCRGRRP